MSNYPHQTELLERLNDWFELPPLPHPPTLVSLAENLAGNAPQVENLESKFELLERWNPSVATRLEVLLSKRKRPLTAVNLRRAFSVWAQSNFIEFQAFTEEYLSEQPDAPIIDVLLSAAEHFPPGNGLLPRILRSPQAPLCSVQVLIKAFRSVLAHCSNEIIILASYPDATQKTIATYLLYRSDLDSMEAVALMQFVNCDAIIGENGIRPDTFPAGPIGIEPFADTEAFATTTAIGEVATLAWAGIASEDFSAAIERFKKLPPDEKRRQERAFYAGLACIDGAKVMDLLKANRPDASIFVDVLKVVGPYFVNGRETLELAKLMVSEYDTTALDSRQLSNVNFATSVALSSGNVDEVAEWLLEISQPDLRNHIIEKNIHKIVEVDPYTASRLIPGMVRGHGRDSAIESLIGAIPDDVPSAAAWVADIDDRSVRDRVFNRMLAAGAATDADAAVLTELQRRIQETK